MGIDQKPYTPPTHTETHVPRPWVMHFLLSKWPSKSSAVETLEFKIIRYTQDQITNDSVRQALLDFLGKQNF